MWPHLLAGITGVFFKKKKILSLGFLAVPAPLFYDFFIVLSHEVHTKKHRDGLLHRRSLSSMIYFCLNKIIPAYVRVFFF